MPGLLRANASPSRSFTRQGEAIGTQRAYKLAVPRSVGFFVFLAIVLLLVGSVHYWVWARLVRDLQLPPGWQRGLGGLVALLGLSIPLTFYLSRTLDPSSGRPLLLVLYAWLGIVFWLVVLLSGAELVRIAAWIWEHTQESLNPAFVAERRTTLARALGGAVVLLVGGFTIAGARSALGRVQVKRVEIPLKRLPKDLDGFSIVQLTDVHVGPTIGREFIEDIVATCNSLQADVIAITGDLVDGPVSKLQHAVAPLAELKARHGAFFVTGNHEYYSGAEAWCQHLDELGLRVLRNEHVSLRNDAGSALDLAGVDDLQGGRVPGHGADLGAALKDRNPAHPVVLLAHQPRQVTEAAEHGVDLQLSGHTHGGQLWPWQIFVRLQQPVVAGLAWIRDTAVYVSSGTGYWGPPLRLGAPAEVTQIILRAG